MTTILGKKEGDLVNIETDLIAKYIERFISNGMNVIIKPNICTDYYSFEYGATTNPEVIAALVSLSLGAGAKWVRVMDNPFGGTAQSAYQRSGIEEAVIRAGGAMEVMNSNKLLL